MAVNNMAAPLVQRVYEWRIPVFIHRYFGSKPLIYVYVSMALPGFSECYRDYITVGCVAFLIFDLHGRILQEFIPQLQNCLLNWPTRLV